MHILDYFALVLIESSFLSNLLSKRNRFMHTHMFFTRSYKLATQSTTIFQFQEHDSLNTMNPFSLCIVGQSNLNMSISNRPITIIRGDNLKSIPFLYRMNSLITFFVVLILLLIGQLILTIKMKIVEEKIDFTYIRYYSHSYTTLIIQTYVAHVQ